MRDSLDAVGGVITHLSLDVWKSRNGLWGRLPPMVHSVPSSIEFQEGDVVGMYPSGFVRRLYRASSNDNSILVTDRCNSLCLMCSQPPKAMDDSDRVWELFRLIELIPSSAKQLGITGGEPTLLGDQFVALLDACKNRLPSTGLHVLTNGRLFYYKSFVREVAAVEHPHVIFGVPLYGDTGELHDHVVQARGAFDQTVRGLHHLALFEQKVEIRVVLNALTFRRLPQLTEFVYRNCPFAVHVAFMGMEYIGLVGKNVRQLHIDPVEYQRELNAAVRFLFERGMQVSVYNLPLCVLDRSLWPFARKSISDWKNVYLPVCEKCSVRDDCAGFFRWAPEKLSRDIKPIRAESAFSVSATAVSRGPENSPEPPARAF